MAIPDLQALQRGDDDAWDLAFDWLWPMAFDAANVVLENSLPNEVEEVAIESIEALIVKVSNIKAVEEIKFLTVVIARNRAVDRLRKHTAEKRGEGKSDSLDDLTKGGDFQMESTTSESPLNAVDQVELGALLRPLLDDLKPETRALMTGYYVERLTYEELATKQSLLIATVGTNLKRGLEAIRRRLAAHPRIVKELEAFLRSTR